MNADRKRELRNSYKERKVVGGICCIRCSGNGRVLLQKTRDVESLRNRFQFSMSMRCCPDPSLRAEFARYGADSFSFEVLEELKKGAEQTDSAFMDDLNALYEMWVEKARPAAQ